MYTCVLRSLDLGDCRRITRIYYICYVSPVKKRRLTLPRIVLENDKNPRYAGQVQETVTAMA